MAELKWQRGKIAEHGGQGDSGWQLGWGWGVNNGYRLCGGLESKGLPGGSMVKNPPARAGDKGLIPGWRRNPGEGNGNPLQYSCLGNSMSSLGSCSPQGHERVGHNGATKYTPTVGGEGVGRTWGRKGLDVTERLNLQHRRSWQLSTTLSYTWGLYESWSQKEACGALRIGNFEV